jgi:transcriptional regulator with XRE-family HTH domain
MATRRIDAEVRRASDLGPIIAQVREARDIRQGDLSDDLGFARSYLAKLESGRPVIQLTRLFQVLRRLGIRVTLSFEAPEPSATAPSGDADRG